MGIAERFTRVRKQARRGRCLGARPEVLVPGVGWRGFGPIQGIATTEGDVALMRQTTAATMPVTAGSYADGVTATLDCIRRIRAAA
jgi:hypothetical protein